MNLGQIIKDVLASKRSVCIPVKPMSRHTSFQVGGSAELFVCPTVEEDLAEVLRIRRESRVLWRILGNGSNLLVSDKGCEGVVISTEQLSGLGVNGNLLRTGAGQFPRRATHLVLEHSLTGMEFAVGIPGSVDGASVMNAGAYSSEAKDILKSTRVMTGEDRILDLPAGDLELGYHTGCTPSCGYIVLGTIHELRPGDRGVIEERMRELAIRQREKQPLEYPSADSTSKRPQGYFAGKSIESAGLRGYQAGGAQVSEKHCGFAINKDHTTVSHMVELCNHIRKTVKEISGVELKMEAERWGGF